MHVNVNVCHARSAPIVSHCLSPARRLVVCRSDGVIVRKADILLEPHFPGSSLAAHTANAASCEGMCNAMPECKVGSCLAV